MSVMQELRDVGVPIYHVSNIDDSNAACGLAEEGDVVVPLAEAVSDEPGSRHVNCPECDHVRTQGRRHVEPHDWQPPEGWTPDGE